MWTFLAIGTIGFWIALVFAFLLLPINESDSASYTFQNYIRENFYKKRIKTALCLEECLIKGSTKIVTKTKFNRNRQI